MPLPGLRFILLPATLVFAVAALSAPPHLALRRSEPAKDSELRVAPARISLWFTAKPEAALSRIELSSAAGSVALDAVVADTGNALHARIPRTLSAGTYTVNWQTASGDGHPIRGEFRFTLLADAATSTTSAPPPPADTAHAHPPPPTAAADSSAHGASVDVSEYRSVRWMEFVALLTVLGALGFRHGVLPPLAARGVPTLDAADRARRLGMAALLLYGVAAIVRLYSTSAAFNPAGSPLAPESIRPLLLQTTWGMGWLVGAVGALFLLVGWVVSKRSTGIGTPLALTGALGLVMAPALTGHAASSDAFITSITLDTVHVAAAGVWLGGLFMLLVAGIPAMRRLTDGNPDAAVSALVNSFHPLALVCAPLVVIAGVGSAWLRLGAFDDLWTTDYGTFLFRKVVLFLLVAGFGAYNATRGRKRLGTADGTAHLRRTAAMELLGVALVLAATAYLVSTPVPSHMVQP